MMFHVISAKFTFCICVTSKLPWLCIRTKILFLVSADHLLVSKWVFKINSTTSCLEMMQHL